MVLHIEFLLKYHDCVILPRLGALIASECAATFSDMWGSIQAPVREIYFNSSIVHNDGLLAHSVARREQITYEEACRLVDKDIEEMKVRLAEDGEVRIGRIGLLRKSDDGRLVYKPLFTPEKRAARLGLAPVSLPQLAETAKVASAAENRGVELEDAEFKKEVSRRNLYMVSKRAMKVAAALLILICGALSFVIPSKSEINVKRDYASMLPIMTELNGGKQSVITPDIVEVNTEEDTYNLIVASLHSTKDAELFVSQHSECGYDLQIMEESKYIRVVACKASNADDLLKVMHEAIFAKEFPGSWIMKLQ